MLDFLPSLETIISGKGLTLFSDGEDLKLFENRVLWRILRTKRKEITGEFSVELHGLYFVQNVVSDTIKRDVLGKTCSGSRRDGKCI